MTAQLTMTAAGLAAITDAANVGTEAVQFLKLAIGVGTAPAADDQSARAALIDQKMTVAVTGAASGTTRIAIRADYTPTENFSVTEAGLFARIGDNGAEFLAAYWVAEDANGALAAAAIGTALTVAGVIAIENSDADITVTPATNISVGAPAGVAYLVDLDRYARLIGDTFTGAISAPTPAANANSTLVATTAWVRSRIGAINFSPFARLAGATFWGALRAPTPAANANSTLVATTAWVRSHITARNAVATLQSGAIVNWGAGASPQAKLTLTQDTAIAITGLLEGGVYYLWVKQDATGGHSLEWPGSVDRGLLTGVPDQDAGEITFFGLSYVFGQARLIAQRTDYD